MTTSRRKPRVVRRVDHVWTVGPEAVRQTYGRDLCECAAAVEFTRKGDRVTARCLGCKKEVKP